MRKHFFIVGIAGIIMIVISSCISQTERSQNKIEPEQFISDRLIVSFDNSPIEGIIATTSINRTNDDPDGIENTKFMSYFSSRLSRISKKVDGIDSVSVHWWFRTDDAASIKITFRPGLSKEEENKRLTILIDYLYNEKYIEKVEYVEPMSKA